MSKQPKKYYDLRHWDDLYFRKKRIAEGATHEFGLEVEAILPKAGEVRLLGNRNNQCLYYL